jgi:hypothetical protein
MFGTKTSWDKLSGKVKHSSDMVERVFWREKCSGEDHSPLSFFA